MSVTINTEPEATPRDELINIYQQVRRDTERLCEPLTVEDHTIQTMEDVSPPKWHLAHTTWFFETFVLQPFVLGYQLYNSDFPFLFNSYYQTLGPFFPRRQRGLLSRPGLDEIRTYRKTIDRMVTEAVDSMPEQTWQQCLPRLTLGIHHEQQHQELLLTDIKHIFATNPMRPAYRKGLQFDPVGPASTVEWWPLEEGIYRVGASGTSFCFDNETPRHKVYLAAGRVCSTLVSNRDFLEFIEADGYRRPELWLSDGWQAVCKHDWQAPLYWHRDGNHWVAMTLAGPKRLDMNEPVCHVSYYEADAYARWSNKRLPTEFEWECMAGQRPVSGNFADNGIYQPRPASAANPFQLYGDVWEWTSSPYVAYPGYRPAEGALGEYNGKFMANQMVLRGGSCATPASHIRATYRNFFYPWNRWQFMGFRLAEWV